jgi:hypothetical protein
MTEEDKKEQNPNKFAKPDSPAFRAKFAQDRRKKRKQKNEDSGLLPNERP